MRHACGSTGELPLFPPLPEHPITGQWKGNDHNKNGEGVNAMLRASVSVRHHDDRD